MSTVAIVAEYNPFHNGHKYHLDESKKLTGAEHAMAVMSGNFVQRGEPAVFNKLIRAEAAVRNGLDLVFELPVRFSTASAQDFAYASVEMINSLGIAEYLSFGAETDDINVLKKISDCLTNETASFKASLNDYLKEGNSFPKARSLALTEEFGEEYAEILSTPNNILAIEYLSALTKLDSNIRPVAVKRFGAGHDSDITDNKYASGKLIRESLKAGNESISTFIPEDISERPIFSSDIQSILNIELMKLQRNIDAPSEYSNILDITPDILNKLRNLSLPASYEDMIDSLKSKELTRSRICRVLIHLLLGIRDIKGIKYCPYATLLALRKDSSHLLRSINEKSDITIINKRSDYKPDSEYASALYIYDRLATDIYNLLFYSKTNINRPNELASNIVLV
ncbi:MAG: nucleotidyltransferase family protein [Eubacterium sp.]|nr:nucleotidyltransferase family protein [Eubacterium sp.]